VKVLNFVNQMSLQNYVAPFRELAPVSAEDNASSDVQASTDVPGLSRRLEQTWESVLQADYVHQQTVVLRYLTVWEMMMMMSR
jgi:hypothetical protein